MRPPRSCDGLCRRKPIVGPLNERGIDEVFALGAALRIDQRLDMSARAEHEFVVAAESARHPVPVPPRGDVVVETGDDEFVALDLRDVDGNAENVVLTGM